MAVVLLDWTSRTDLDRHILHPGLSRWFPIFPNLGPLYSRLVYLSDTSRIDRDMFERRKDLLGLLSIHILLDDILDLGIRYRRGVVKDVGKGCPVRFREKSGLETESLTGLDPETLVGDDRLMESSRDPFVHVLDIGGVFWVEIPFV